MKRYDSKAARATERSYINHEIIKQRAHTIEALGLRAGEQILDAGCGPGLLAQQMAIIVGDKGRVTGVDYSQDMLELATTRCSGMENVVLQQGSVESLDFEDESFDVVTCTQTLLYVKNVDRAVDEIQRVLKPGGRVAILETDWRGVVLNNQNDEMTRKMFDAWDDAVESPNMPVKLGPMLRARKFNAIKVEAIPIVNTSDNEDNFSSSMLRWLTKNAVINGAVSKEECDQWMQEIRQLADRDEQFFCVNRFLFTAVK